MSILAKRHNVSDVALAKVRRKLQVPVPARGYWAKVRSGQRMNTPKLPRLRPGTPEVAKISPNLLRSLTIPEAVREQLSFEPLRKSNLGGTV
ncbi:hypothetical protein [Edaphobacter aggregans]|uniref:hypothetical protein n=1 Tax=Edaphobacter aggregans TaxID=570835 RepID=UPI000F745D0A|nr:hypothetical protein [Edaphobacter aggregans]